MFSRAARASSSVSIPSVRSTFTRRIGLTTVNFPVKYGETSSPREALSAISSAPIFGLVLRFERMELAIQVQIEELPEGLFLATSEELPGLVAQGRTVAEALEIARDVARRLLEAQRERDGIPNLPSTMGRRDYTIVVAA